MPPSINYLLINDLNTHKHTHRVISVLTQDAVIVRILRYHLCFSYTLMGLCTFFLQMENIILLYFAGNGLKKKEKKKCCFWGTRCVRVNMRSVFTVIKRRTLPLSLHLDACGPGGRGSVTRECIASSHRAEIFVKRSDSADGQGLVWPRGSLSGLRQERSSPRSLRRILHSFPHWVFSFFFFFFLLFCFWLRVPEVFWCAVVVRLTRLR